MSAPIEIQELQQLVQEKDELLKVLTERLELAAEQLDRLRRQGGPLEPARHHSQPGPLDDPELTEDLRQMLADWRGLQDRGWFGSLDERLDGIRDLVTNLEHTPVHSPVQEARTLSVADILTRYSTKNEESEVAAESGKSESIEEPAETNCDAPPANLELPDAPQSVDIDSCSTEELRNALRLCEDYIVRLRDYLVAYDAANASDLGSVDLGPLTPEQRAGMEAWEAKVRKELRQTQIQLWVERAQLSREQMSLQQLQHHLDTESKRLGITKNKGVPGKGAPASDEADGQRSKTWLGLFGNK